MLTPEKLLYGYSMGIFPMAHPGEEHTIYWYEPELRGIVPLQGLKISKSLKQTIRSGRFEVRMDERFEEVMQACAAREETWISKEIIGAYTNLFKKGYAHSFETYNTNNELVGGLYGVSMGKAFFGESMFHRERDASKVALVSLVNWMNEHNFQLLDTQYLTDHLASMGAIEISQKEYLLLLEKALQG